MTDGYVTSIENVVPGGNKRIVYFYGTKAAQNDNMILTTAAKDYGIKKCYWASAMVEPSSGNTVAETIQIVDATPTYLYLTASTVGTVYGIALVDV